MNLPFQRFKVPPNPDSHIFRHGRIVMVLSKVDTIREILDQPADVDLIAEVERRRVALETLLVKANRTINMMLTK